eukprot:TRINITY_DN2069_c1_g1_i1.p1 TRINITY_DN2069_c1_g1~~TRINITY_DN2069_c1_g1_i1.p1  ORF type:complete len:315 (-),score=54.57 TRINITY_DN2069_c1_g1_i1:172-1053(-)
MLAGTTAGTLVADKTYTFTVLSTESIESVLGKLAIHDLLSLPVIDATTHQIVGMVSILDLLVFLCWGPYFESTTTDVNEATTWKNLDRPISHLLGLTAEGRKLWIAEATMPLSSLLEPFGKGLHRVLVPQKDDEGKHTHRVLSQSDVVAYLFKHREEVADLLSKTLNELAIQPKPVVSITTATSALEGFKTMTLDKVPAVAILENGKIVGNLSASDLRGITGRRLKKTVLPVRQFLECIHGSLRDPITISLNDTLARAMELLVTQEVHRLWIVNEKNEPIGCISLTDVIRVFN